MSSAARKGGKVIRFIITADFGSRLGRSGESGGLLGEGLLAPSISLEIESGKRQNRCKGIGMKNTVVLHFVGGILKKGTTDDFFPNKDSFHFRQNEGDEVQVVKRDELKAVFFVKTFEGNPGYEERDDLDRAGFGRKIKVKYKDGETQIGYTQGYQENRPGFFVFPCDPDSNNDRIFVISSQTDSVEFL
jgi:hypothetical protein